MDGGDRGDGGERGAGAERDADLTLARIHLLLGSLSLARAELETLAGRGALDDDAVARVQQAIVDSGALADLEAHIVALTDEAIAAIRRAPVAPEAVEELVALAHLVSQRTV
jgi:geranylgeranyl diphosphate synthase type I